MYTIDCFTKQDPIRSSNPWKDASMSEMERFEPQPAPDFELADSHGVMTRLSGYRGKVVVLVFNRGFA